MNFIAHYGIPLKKKSYALSVTIPMARRGETYLSPSYSMALP